MCNNIQEQSEKIIEQIVNPVLMVVWFGLLGIKSDGQQVPFFKMIALDSCVYSNHEALFNEYTAAKR